MSKSQKLYPKKFIKKKTLTQRPITAVTNKITTNEIKKNLRNYVTFALYKVIKH